MKTKVTLEILNASKAIKPSKGDIIMFDESKKGWCIVTKEEILSECNELLNETRKELSFCRGENQKIREANEEFKRSVSAQIYDMSELIKQLYSK